MSLGVQIVAAWVAFVALFGLGMLLWAVETDQFDDIDAIKRIPLDELEPEGWPGRAMTSKEA